MVINELYHKLTERIHGYAAIKRRREEDPLIGRLSSAYPASFNESWREISEEDPAQDKEQDFRSGIPQEEERVHGHAGAEITDPRRRECRLPGETEAARDGQCRVTGPSWEASAAASTQRWISIPIRKYLILKLNKI